MVIGLEVHCELATDTKLFCACAEPLRRRAQHQRLPGLPRPARLAAGAQRAAPSSWPCASGRPCGCDVEPSIFARKNYFYPDMPKDYQVSQYDLPINVDGHLELPDGMRVGIERAHIEEDTGKFTHVGGGGRIHDAAHSLVDYNRAGVPLVEIVSGPDIRTAEQAQAYVAELRAILARHRASATPRWRRARCGSTPTCRSAAPGEPWGTRCEIKNLNSLRSLGRAIDYEARRQIDLLEAGERVGQETRHWDEDDGRTDTLRSKEEADDYRYFPEPDLVPLDPTDEWHRAHRRRPARRCRPTAGAPWPTPPAASRPTDAVVLAVERGLDDLAARRHRGRRRRRPGAHPRRAQPRRRRAPRRLSADRLAALVPMETGGELTATQAKPVLAEMVATGDDPRDDRRGEGLRGDGHRRPRGARRRGHRRPPDGVGAASAPATTRPGASSPASSWARS